jgi:gliding motility-associated lipoprotein GldD
MKHSTNLSVIFLLLVVPAFIMLSCGSDDYIPKPRGFFRINFPEKKYRLYDSTCPYTFEYPTYARIMPDPDVQAEPCWINVEFPSFNGTLHLSYKVVHNNVYQYFEDAHSFVSKHIPKADNIVPVDYVDDTNRVWGLIYEIEGSGVASTYQFCVTDSIHHFLRGALYFNAVPNNDSLAPVLDFIHEDIDHLVSTIRWKN